MTFWRLHSFCSFWLVYIIVQYCHHILRDLIALLIITMPEVKSDWVVYNCVCNRRLSNYQPGNISNVCHIIENHAERQLIVCNHVTIWSEFFSWLGKCTLRKLWILTLYMWRTMLQNIRSFYRMCKCNAIVSFKCRLFCFSELSQVLSQFKENNKKSETYNGAFLAKF